MSPSERAMTKKRLERRSANLKTAAAEGPELKGIDAELRAQAKVKMAHSEVLSAAARAVTAFEAQGEDGATKRQSKGAPRPQSSQIHRKREHTWDDSHEWVSSLLLD